jgi:hypothetical protein
MQWPASGAVEVTPSDGSDLAVFTRGIYVGASGDVVVTTVGGNVVTFVGLAAGMIHPICARRIWSTGTTATDIVGVY